MNEKLEAERQSLLAQMRDLSTPDAFLAMTATDRQLALKKVGIDYIDVMLELHTKVVLSIDGNQGCALLGENLQEGVCYFIPVKRVRGESKLHAGRRAAMAAYRELLTKLGRREKDLPYVWQ